MRFTITHTRAFIGSNITVQVEADAKEGIRSVDVVLDGNTLGTSDVQQGTESFAEDFSAVGDASAGTMHDLRVTATSNDGLPHGSTTRWVDTI